jgi:hypothetical protein
MKFLLPHRYKKTGAIIAPLGFALWLFMQFGYVTKLLMLIFGEHEVGSTSSTYHVVKAIIGIGSFFSFLGGIYFIAFSREKVEDEMVQRTRLDSFQFAAFVQIVVIIAGFLLMLFAGEPGDGGLMLFFVVLLFLFWLSFIGRFNYILHIRLRQ